MELQQIEIDGRTLRARKFATRHGLRVLTRLSAVVGPALANAGDVQLAVGSLLDRVKPDDVDWLIDEFAQQTEYLAGGGNWLKLSIGDVFDTAFGSNYGAVIKWLKWSLEINFADFLASIGLTRLKGASQAA